MRLIRQSKFYSLFKTDEKKYFVLRKRDKKRSPEMTKDEAEALILDDGFNKECKLLSYEWIQPV